MGCSVTGANARVCVKEETAYGTFATGNYTFIDFESLDMQAEDTVTGRPLLGRGNEPQRGTRGPLVARGTLVLAVDLVVTPVFLRYFLGPPTTTGSTNYTHVFKSGSDAVISFSMEVQHTDAASGAPVYTKYSGVIVDSMTPSFDQNGRPTLGLIAADEDETNVSVAGTPVAVAPTFYNQKSLTILRDGAHLPKVARLGIVLSRNVDPFPELGRGGKVTCVTPGMWTMGGDLALRFDDTAYYQVAKGETLFDFAWGWEVDPNRKIVFELEQCELARRGKAIGGPGPVERTYRLIASKDLSEGQALKVTVNNQQATY
jgi:hypothetical protein